MGLLLLLLLFTKKSSSTAVTAVGLWSVWLPMLLVEYQSSSSSSSSSRKCAGILEESRGASSSYGSGLSSVFPMVLVVCGFLCFVVNDKQKRLVSPNEMLWLLRFSLGYICMVVLCCDERNSVWMGNSWGNRMQFNSIQFVIAGQCS